MRKRVIYPDLKHELGELQPIEELKGKLRSDFNDEKLMHSVLEGDKQHIEDGKLVMNAINQGIGAFTPDLVFDNMVNSYSLARKLYGERLIRQLSGYDPEYIEKNIMIPEFRRELKNALRQKYDKLKEQGYIEEDGSISTSGHELASLTLYFEELDRLVPKGFIGEKFHKTGSLYGDRNDVVSFRKQSYRDIAVRKSIKAAVRHGHDKVMEHDLRAYKRKSKGQIYIFYALDASGSMKGGKIEQCKKAGVALAFKAIDAKDKVGLLVFGDRVKLEIAPSNNFVKILKAITGIRAANETNIADTILHAINLFPRSKVTKHLILITDALPTLGRDPKRATLEAVSLAKANGITISMIGIQLDKKGENLAKKIVAIGEGRLYAILDLDNIDGVVLEDYKHTLEV